MQNRLVMYVFVTGNGKERHGISVLAIRANMGFAIIHLDCSDCHGRKCKVAWVPEVAERMPGGYRIYFRSTVPVNRKSKCVACDRCYFL